MLVKDQNGRRSGLATDIQIRSSRIQHGIAGNQLNFLDNRTDRIRFHDDPDNNNATAGEWHDWAAGTTGTEITVAEGLRVEFDWIAGNDTSANWISVNMGISGPGAGEPGFRVNHVETDIGMLLRFNGDTELFDNEANLGAQGSFTPIIGPRHVIFDYSFSSFADGSEVSLIASVDGTEVYNGTGFTWDNNLGALYFEIGTLESTLIDNVEISALNPNAYIINLDGNTFSSGAPQGTPVGDLSGSISGNPDASTFSLVAGDGDTDNDKFQINGSSLEVGNFDFTGANSIDGQQYSVRIEGIGSETTERFFTITLIKDDDADNLNDVWETTWAGNLTDLSGAVGNEDFDGDGLTDIQEFQISNGTFDGGSTPYPGIDPTKKDTDEDTLEDLEEIIPTGSRPQTDPTNADTDSDGLDDAIETNTRTLVDEDDTGTDPTNCDTDGDYSGDLWEITYNSDPFDPNDAPGPLGPVSITPITDTSSTGIDPAKSYTHLISGGQDVTVNGVTFNSLAGGAAPVIPANFTWDTMGNTMSSLTARPGDWDPVTAGADAEVEALLTSFSYSGNGAAPGASQRFTLTGLSPGTTYDLRIYSRTWSLVGSGRPSELVFTNGGEVVRPYDVLPLDRPGLITGSGIHNDAYYLTYQYTAQGTELIIDATVPQCSIPVSGSFHLYALSNEVANGVPLGQILITNHNRLPDGRFAIAFRAKPLTDYRATKSLNLIDEFTPFDTPLTVTTDTNGDGQIIIPAFETSDVREFYRIEE